MQFYTIHKKVNYLKWKHKEVSSFPHIYALTGTQRKLILSYYVCFEINYHSLLLKHLKLGIFCLDCFIKPLIDDEQNNLQLMAFNIVGGNPSWTNF